MRYAVIINDLASFRIGQSVEVKDDTTSDSKYYALGDKEHCHFMRKDCLRFIDKDEFELLKVKTEAIKKYIEIIDDEDNPNCEPVLNKFSEVLKSII